MDKKTIQQKDYIAGLGKGMAILECFDSERQRLSATTAAEKTGVTRAAARRHLLTLQHLGYLESDGQYFYLTPKMLKFSSAYLSSSPLAKIAQPLLNLLTVQTGNVCSIMVLDGYEAITIVRSNVSQMYHPSERVHPYGINLGHRLPAFATSAGKVLLAFLTEIEQEKWLTDYPLKRLTKHTVTDPAVFRQQLQQIKSQEWCYACEEHELHIHAIAVPIFQSTSRVIAALNMVSTTSRCSTPLLQQDMLPLLQNTARELRQVL